MSRPLRVGQFWEMLLCMTLPYGSLEIDLNCTTQDLPVFPNSAVAPTYPQIITIVPHGTPINYVCNQGFLPKPGKNTTIFCMNGSWIPTKDPCERGCDTAFYPVFKYSVPAQGFDPNPKIVPHGTSVTYVCKPGAFVSRGRTTNLVCISGSWLPNVDPCERGCSRNTLPTFRFSEVQPWPPNPPSHFAHSTQVRYQCKPGSQLQSGFSLIVTCLRGTWNHGGDPCHVPASVTASAPAPSTASAPAPTTASAPTPTGASAPTPTGAPAPTPTGAPAPTPTGAPAPAPTGAPAPAPTGASTPAPNGDSTPATMRGTVSIIASIPARVTDSIDDGVLIIQHAIIVQGKKPKYNPGDRVTVECLPGYILNGDSELHYQGGNEWLPKIPSCSLSIFISIFVAGIALGILVLIFLVVYKSFQPQESSRITLVRYHRR